jgi:hypothetical protein
MLAVRMRIVPAPVLNRARSVRFWGFLLGAMSTSLAATSALAGPPFITDQGAVNLGLHSTY